MPEQGHQAARLRHRFDGAPGGVQGRLARQSEIPEQSHVHDGQGQFEDRPPVRLEWRDAALARPEPIGESERGVVAETGGFLRRPGVRARKTQEMVPDADGVHAQRLAQGFPAFAVAVRLVETQISAMQPDLAAGRADEIRDAPDFRAGQPIPRPMAAPVGIVQDEKRGPEPVPGLDLQDRRKVLFRRLGSDERPRHAPQGQRRAPPLPFRPDAADVVQIGQNAEQFAVVDLVHVVRQEQRERAAFRPRWRHGAHGVRNRSSSNRAFAWGHAAWMGTRNGRAAFSNAPRPGL